MEPDPVALALELTQLSPSAREAHYVQLGLSPSLRAKVEDLLHGEGIDGTLASNDSAASQHLIPTESPAPRTIGRYEIVRLLGRGGMGEVYLAHDPLVDRRVAVKLIRGGVDDAEAHRRLVPEARAAGRLRHPNIVTIFDVGAQDGNPYIAMEHVPGESFRSIIRRKAELPLSRRLELVEGACAGLAHAHREGVVHLDVKPDNLMLDVSGIVKVLDFGIARVLKSELLTNHHVGTLRYMSPEQVSGAPLDQRSDVFSLGASLFELVTYSPAYGGSTHEMIIRIAEGPVPRLLDVVPEVDPRLDEIVTRTMALDPLDRFDDLDELRAELARLRLDMDPEAGAHLRSRVATAEGGRTSSSVRSRTRVSRWRPGLIAGLGATGVAAIGLGVLWERSAEPAKTPATTAPAAAAPVVPSPTPSAGDGSIGADDVWRRLALGDRPAVLRLLRSDAAKGSAAANPQLPFAVVDAVRASVRQAREGVSATPSLRTTEAFRLAEAHFARASRLQANGQPLDALGALWQAADEYARVSAAGQPPPVQPVQPAPGPIVPESRQAGSVSSAAPPAASIDSPVAPSTPPRTEAPGAPAEVSADRAAAAAVVAPDTEGVMGTLRRYHDAYRALDVSALLQVFPTLGRDQVEQLRRTFAGVTVYEVEARQARVDLTGDVATVHALVSRRMVPRVGRPFSNEVETEFQLRRDGRTWLITNVRAVPGP
jgi:tRNA A-37 threonylcarbamoyl transferase component Bud32